MNACFICESPFHILNSLIIASKQSHKKNDLFLFLYSDEVAKIAGRIREEGVFDKVYTYSYENKNKFLELMITKEYIRRIVKEKDLNPFKYDYIYIPSLVKIGMDMAAVNKNCKVLYYDDGIGSYTEDLQNRTTNVFRAIQFKINNNHCRILYPNTVFLNNIHMNTNKHINTLPITPITEMSKSEIKRIAKIFNYTCCEEYEKRRFIYLTQPVEKDTGNQTDKNTISQILSLFKCLSGNLIIRLHPRDNKIEYSKYSLMIDSSKANWELISASEITDNHILISKNSTAALIPKLLYDKEPVLIFTYRLYSAFHGLNEFELLIKKLKSAYSDGNRIIVIKDFKELKKRIDALVIDK